MNGVPTAVPAFIGYTEKQVDAPAMIESLADYERIFGAGASPKFRLEAVPGEATFAITPVTPAYNLYSSLQLFYANGGGSACVVSAGTYGKPVDADALISALAALQRPGPTMLVVPDAVLLPPDDPNVPYVSAAFTKVAQAMLAQCVDLQDRVAIFDVYGGGSVTKTNLDAIAGAFRAAIPPGMSWGAAYLPFLVTAITPETITYANIDSASAPLLITLLTTEAQQLYSGVQQTEVLALIDQIANQTSGDVAALNQKLLDVSPLLTSIENAIAARTSALPPSGAIAGVYVQNDATRGVWNAPANIALARVLSPVYHVSDSEQGTLNTGGKAINVIRQFPSLGSLVWGARTLDDDDSSDYRYIQVRRTIIYIEQSLEQTLQQFVFAANDATTWSAVVSSFSAFLTPLWQEGALVGNSAAEAFTVQCGLGSTMTSQDILNGYMRVQVLLQMIRPAEYIELTFEQKLAS